MSPPDMTNNHKYPYKARLTDIPGPASFSEGDTGATSFYDDTERGTGSERSLAGVFH